MSSSELPLYIDNPIPPISRLPLPFPAIIGSTSPNVGPEPPSIITNDSFRLVHVSVPILSVVVLFAKRVL